MKRLAAAVILAGAALSLAGCAAPAGASDSPTTSLPQKKLEIGNYGMVLMKPDVDGTELICVKDNSYEAISCNWELWNKTRETAK